MISRGYAWMDENVEHSEADERRAAVLARRWSALQSEIEEEGFRREFDADRGYDYEPPECNGCGGTGVLGINDPKSWRSTEVVIGCQFPPCWKCGPYITLIGITCPACGGDGVDHEPEQRLAERRAERDLEIELLEDKLAAIGARMMRPYEHWNEDEALMAYMERER